MSSGAARRIEPAFYSKIWGSPRLEPWFHCDGQEIGEVWFPAGDLLIKFIFTSQNLSVQVHPEDSYARKHENSRGKTEMWHVLRADPGARIALGFRQAISREELVTASQTGQIVDLLNWMEVRPGETYFVPAGTVHAIGAGLALCEIQQNSDVTYRLFDYGRNRDLHLQKALSVADLGLHPGKSMPRDVNDQVQLLAECDWFKTYHMVLSEALPVAPKLNARFLIVLEGQGRINGAPAVPGNVFEDANSRQWLVEPERAVLPGSMRLLLIA